MAHVVMAHMAATMHAVTATMSATVTATRGCGSDGSSGQSECGDSCEREFTKHIVQVLHV
jgi:hypothetical protein